MGFFGGRWYVLRPPFHVVRLLGAAESIANVQFREIGKKEKKKGKKGAVEPDPAPPPPEDNLIDTMDEPATADVLDTPADDTWASLGTKSSKKSKKGSKTTEPVIEDKLSKTKSKESKSSKDAADDILDILDKAPPPPPEPETVVESPKVEKKATKSSGWGSIFGSSGSKSSKKDKEAKEKAEREVKTEADKAAAEEAQRKADEEAFAAALGDDPNEILDVVDEAPIAPSKGSKKKSDKTSKLDAKADKKSKAKDPVAAIVDEPGADPVVDIIDEAPPVDDKPTGSAAGWGFWGASLKSSKSGKKATPVAETSKEISSSNALGSGEPELSEPPKMPEDTFPTDTGLKSSASKSKTKSSKGSSIQDRIKALQGDSADSGAKKSSKSKDPSPPSPPAPEPLLEPEPEAVIAPLSPEEKKSSKKSPKTSSSKKAKDPLPPQIDPAAAPPPPASPLPGGFPSDDIVDLSRDMLKSPPKSSSKDKKLSKSSKDKSRSSKAEPVASPIAVDPMDDLMGLDEPSTKLPTPPPEKASKDDSKGHRKERPKVVRDQGTNSWGFWGATPAPKSSSKDKSRSKDASSPVKERPSGLSRSKSARKSGERDPSEKASKSSGSDKDVKTPSRSRPSTSRGQSGFGAMFGLGSAPSRSKSTKIPSSRRHSTAVDDSGLISPPPESRSRPEISDKAAKVMGVSRSKSTREKTKSRKVPDPYAIDSEDMVMVDGPEDSARDVPPLEKPSGDREKKSRRSRRESTMMSGGLGDDAVMVDATEGKPDDLAFDTRPPLVRRATTSNKKAGLMGGLLGAFGAGTRPSAPDRRQSKAYDSEDGMARRKRGSAYDEDRMKRSRREDRTVNRPRKPSDAEGLTDAAPMTEAEDAAAKEARRAERRERRAREEAEEELRMARRREREEQRKAKAREEEDRLRQEDEEREARRKEERRAKRVERDARRAQEDRLREEEEAKAAERRERRRERDRQRTEEEPASTARPKTDRRRSYAVDTPEEEEARRQRREERRQRRSVDQGAGYEKERPRISRRRTDYPVAAEDYFDKRNGEQARSAGFAAADGPSFVKAGGDKTASWVHSVNEDPPPPPPVEGTIIDAPVHFAADDDVPATHPFEETTAREMRHNRARDGYARDDMERRSHRRRDGENVKSSSGGSSHDRQRSYGGPVGGYDVGGMKTWDGRPAGMQRSESKRGSWLKKIPGLGGLP